MFTALIRFRPVIIVLLAAAACSGCAHFESRPIEPARTADDWAQRSLDNDGLRQFLTRASSAPLAWPLPAWDLDQLTLAAIYEQPSLAVARAQWDVATAGAITAGQRQNPSISASATYDTTTPPPWIPAVSFDIPIETAGKRGYRLAQAQELAVAARWDWVDKIWQVRADVRAALLGVYNARLSAQLLDRQTTAQAEVVRLLEGQLRAGVIPATDVTQARIALDTTRLSLQQARQQENEALGTLANAVGLPVSALAHVPLSFAGLDALPDPAALPNVQREAVLHRADIRSALASYAASQSALQLEIANQYPDIHLGPGYELDQTDNKWTLGITVPLPIFNRNEGPIAEAEAKRRLAAAQFLATQAKAINEADLALANYQGAVAQAHTAAALLQELQQRLESARAMRRAGELDPLGVASAEVEYDTGAAAQLDSRLKAQEALGRLEAAMQSSAVLSGSALEQAQAFPSHEP